MSNSSSKAYISEIFSSFQGEGGTVRGSCFGKRQIFIRFFGCNLFMGDYGSSGCYWCDSPHSQAPQQEHFQYELYPNSQVIKKGKNPIDLPCIIKIICNLITPDLHSISFTGGEPLYQKDFLLALSETLNRKGLKYPLYLETNGSIKLDDKMIKNLAPYFTYCCCDIKDKSSKAASNEMHDELIRMELDFLKKFVALGVNTFAKLVITSQTEIKEVEYISKQLAKIRYSDGHVIGLALQPVTLINRNLEKRKEISLEHLHNLFQAAAAFIPADSLTLSIQAHKYLNLL